MPGYSKINKYEDHFFSVLFMPYNKSYQAGYIYIYIYIYIYTYRELRSDQGRTTLLNVHFLTLYN